MLTPEYLDSCTDEIVELYRRLDEAITRDIVRWLIESDLDVSQSRVYLMDRIQEIGLRVYDDVIQEISSITGASEKELKRLFQEAGTETLRFDDAIYKKAGLNPLPVKQSAPLLQTLIAGYEKCGRELKNLTLTTATASQTLFINTCNQAYMQLVSGAFDYNTVVKNAVVTIGKTGTHIIYPTGHRDHIDVAVRRAALTGVGQTAGRLQILRMDEMDCDLVETTAHMGARESHSYWQGQIFSRSGRGGYPNFEESTGYGSGEGLLGYNCRHNFFPYFEGISKRAYTAGELKHMQEHKVTYNNRKYTDYQASQIQRRMERDIRSSKRQKIAIDEAIKKAGDNLPMEFSAYYRAISEELKRQNKNLKIFLEQTNRVKEHARTRV